MKQNSVSSRWRETLWRRPLTDAEAAEARRELATSPEAQADWLAEQQLTRALHRLPDVPVSSNFTALVLQAVERETAADARRATPVWRQWWRSLGWAPKFATALAVLGVSVLSVQQYRGADRDRMADSVAALAETSQLPSPEILQDFDAISRLAQTPPADEELLALMQ